MLLCYVAEYRLRTESPSPAQIKNKKKPFASNPIYVSTTSERRPKCRADSQTDDASGGKAGPRSLRVSGPSTARKKSSSIDIAFGTVSFVVNAVLFYGKSTLPHHGRFQKLIRSSSRLFKPQGLSDVILKRPYFVLKNRFREDFDILD